MRCTDFSESSRIATVMSRKHGKIALIAKGARKPKSKFAGMIRPGNLLDVVYYYKSTRGVQTLSDASYNRRLGSLSTDIGKMAISMRSLELIGQLIHENEVNEPVFEFMRNFLGWLDVQDEVHPRLFPYLQVRMASLAGLELQVQVDETVAVEETGGGYLNIEAGNISTRAVSTNAVRLTDRQFRFLVQVSQSKKASILNWKLENGELKSLVDHLDNYFRYHVEGMKPRKTDAIFDQLLKH